MLIPTRAYPPPSPIPPSSSAKSWIKYLVILLVIVIVVAGIIGIALSNNSGEHPNNPTPTVTPTTANPTSTPTVPESPAMSIISPLSVTYHNASVPLDFGANVLTGEPEVVYLRYSLDGNANVTLTELKKTGTQNFAPNKTGVTYHVEEMLNNLEDGNHTLRVYSHDANGNEMSGSVEFTVDTHNETSTQTDNFFNQNPLLLTTIAFIAVVVGISVGLLVYRKKHKR